MRRGRAGPAVLALIGAAALAAAPAASGAGARRYLILPFENVSSEPGLNWLGEALAMSLADRFELLGMRTVGREERAEAQDALGFPPGTPTTLATSLRLAGLLRAGRMVTGTYTFDPGSGVTVAGRLVDVEGARQIWEGKRPGTLAGIFRLMDPLVLEAAAQDDARLSPASPSTIGSVSDPPLPLYEAIVRGLKEPDPERRVAALEKGLEMNRQAPSLLRALGWALFAAERPAEALERLNAVPDEAAPDAWRVHLLRARIHVARNETEAAEASLARSIAAADSADAHLLLARIHAARGDLPRARAELDLAAGLDPAHPEVADVRELLTAETTPVL